MQQRRVNTSFPIWNNKKIETYVDRSSKARIISTWFGACDWLIYVTLNSPRKFIAWSAWAYVYYVTILRTSSLLRIFCKFIGQILVFVLFNEFVVVYCLSWCFRSSVLCYFVCYCISWRRLYRIDEYKNELRTKVQRSARSG